MTDTGTAPAVTDGDTRTPASDIPFDVDGTQPDTTHILLDDARAHLDASAKKLRRLADQIDEATTERVLDVFIELQALKKDAEAIVNATTKQIGDAQHGVMELLLDEFAEQGHSSVRHAASGRLAYINDRYFPRVTEGHERGEVAEHMARVDELADFVEPGFNLNSLRSHFSDQIKALKAQGAVIDDAVLTRLIPDELHGLLELVPSPTIGVRRS